MFSVMYELGSVMAAYNVIVSNSLHWSSSSSHMSSSSSSWIAMAEMPTARAELGRFPPRSAGLSKTRLRACPSNLGMTLSTTT